MSSADPEAPEQEATETDERREALLAGLAERLGDDLLGSHILPGRDLWIRVTPAAWVSTMRHLRDDLGFRFFEFLSAIDWLPSPYGRYEEAAVDVDLPALLAAALAVDPSTLETGVAGGDTRYQVFARVMNLAERDLGIIVKVDVPPVDADPHLPGAIGTIVAIYPGADWNEREVHEMYGIGFEGNPNLRNLYLPTGFEGHPLRKDYPLLARHVKPWPGIVDVEAMPDEGGDEEEGDQ
ncbi:NADH-quinone oxidoreductase subunit C [Acidimicrobiia bacterium EGI L10123]|uniref:NADH-quinone oxidoreductase subunit C n=1 Tax=Salinilacustrithrix flava TaxID=2957203 RepID=UPI003D7C1C71|nr:NADH-quinone oxidoreductase subunit C [Acidimicrobiia bacterium EGI L10123]